MAHTYLAGLLKDEIIRCEKNGQQKMYYLESDVEAILAESDQRSGRARITARRLRTPRHYCKRFLRALFDASEAR